MPVDLVVKGGTIVTPDWMSEGSLAMDEGRIVAIGSDSSMPKADRVIDASGKHVMSGVIDPHMHLGVDRGFGEDCVTETAAAAAGGVTTIGDFYRANASYHDAFPKIRSEVDENCVVDMFFSFGIIRKNQIAEIGEYAERYGVTSFKFFGKYILELLTNRGQTPPPELAREAGDGLYVEGFRKIAKSLGEKGMACVHAENYEIIEWERERIKSEGRNDLLAWCDSRPSYAEEESLRKAVFFAKLFGTRLYNVHMSGAGGVEIVEEALREGSTVIAETCPHYLTFDRSMSELGVRGKETPPLRRKEDVVALWDAIGRGIVKTVASDHVPLMPQDGKDIWSAIPGDAGTETLLPIVLGEGVSKRGISLQKANEVCSRNAAVAFGIYPTKGSLTIGADADVVIVDMKKEERIRAENLHTRSGWSLYEGMSIKGWPTLTISKGRVVYEDGQVIGQRGNGKYLPRALGRFSPAA